MQPKLRNILLLVLNLFIFISTFIITVLGVLYGAGNAQRGTSVIGWGYFKPFTMDSNILMGIIAGIFLVFLILNMVKQKDIPHFVYVFYFMGTVSVMLTFFTVVFFLAPSSAVNATENKALAFFTNFNKDLFFFHFTNPLISLLCYFLLREDKKLGILENIIGVAPMFIYSIVYFLCVVVLKCWRDFYGFTFGGKMYLVPIVMILMYGVTFLIGFIMLLIKKNYFFKK